MELGSRIKQARQTKGITQAQLAAAVGISTRSIQGYELNKSVPHSYELYLKLAKALDVPPEHLSGMPAAQSKPYGNMDAAIKRYGSRGRAQAALLLEQVAQLFSSGELTDSDKMEFMRGMNGIFFNADNSAAQTSPFSARGTSRR